MIEPKDINKLANNINSLNIEGNNGQSDLQKLHANNNSSEDELLKEFKKEVDSPFLETNRRKPIRKPEHKQKQADRLKETDSEDSQDDDEYSFDDLDETDSEDSQDDEADGKEFSKDIVSFLMEGIDYGVNKGSELAGYKKKSGSSDLTRQKEAVIKYGTKVLEKYDFKMTAEHMLLIALMFYIKAVASQFEKDKGESESNAPSPLKIVKPLDKNAPRKPLVKSNVVKMETTNKPKVKQSFL